MSDAGGEGGTRLDRLIGRRGAVIRAEIPWREGCEVDGFLIQANLVRVRDLAAPGEEAVQTFTGIELGIQSPAVEEEGPESEWLLDLDEACEIAERIDLLCGQVAPVEEDSPLITTTYGARDDLTLAVHLPLAVGSRAWSAFIRTPEWQAECDIEVLETIARQLRSAIKRAGRK